MEVGQQHWQPILRSALLCAAIAPSSQRWEGGLAELSADGRCTSDWQCSLSGQCMDGACICDLPWKGADCSMLDLLPANKERPGLKQDNGYQTWCGSMLTEDRSNSPPLFHMFASQLADKKRIGEWQSQSEIVHMVAEQPEGPWKKKGITIPKMAHNPQLHRYVDGTYLLFFIRKDYGCINVATAPSLDAEFTIMPSSILSNRPGQWDAQVTNPSVLIHSNGTIWLYYRGHSEQGHSFVGLAVADHWNSSFQRVFDEPILEHQGEDPFVWKDLRGHYHMLYNSQPSTCELKNVAGAHSWSYDGLHWSPSTLNAFNTTFEFDDGDSGGVLRRERPQIWFDANGQPMYFITAVLLSSKTTKFGEGSYKNVACDGPSFTSVQRLPTSATISHTGTIPALSLCNGPAITNSGASQEVNFMAKPEQDKCSGWSAVRQNLQKEAQKAKDKKEENKEAKEKEKK